MADGGMTLMPAACLSFPRDSGWPEERGVSVGEWGNGRGGRSRVFADGRRSGLRDEKDRGVVSTSTARRRIYR
jgi:hypothetical protein